MSRRTALFLLVLAFSLHALLRRCLCLCHEQFIRRPQRAIRGIQGEQVYERLQEHGIAGAGTGAAAAQLVPLLWSCYSVLVSTIHNGALELLPRSREILRRA